MLRRHPNTPPQVSFRAPSPSPEVNAQEQLEDYLDQALADLIGQVPYRRRQELRREMADHLWSLADAYEELGADPDEAMRQALEQFGTPREIGIQWCAEWSPRTSTSHPLKAAVRPLLGLIPVTLMGWQLAGNSPIAVSWDTNKFFLTLAVLACAIAGFRRGPHRVAGTGLALAGVTAITAALTYGGHGIVHRAMLMLVSFQLFTWIPAGLIATVCAGWIWDRTERVRTRVVAG